MPASPVGFFAAYSESNAETADAVREYVMPKKAVQVLFAYRLRMETCYPVAMVGEKPAEPSQRIESEWRDERC